MPAPKNQTPTPQVGLGDIRQLAGLLEGEGYFAWRQGGARIVLQMCDEDVMRWANWLLRGRFYSYKRKSGLVVFMSAITGIRAVGWMMTLYQFFGERRKEKIKGILAAWRRRGKAMALRTHCPRGHEYTKENTYLQRKGSRECKSCRRMFQGPRPRLAF